MRERRNFLGLPVLALALLLSLAVSPPALADHDADITPYYVGVGQYYGVPESEVMAVERQVRPEEVPVVFHIAAHSGVAPARVLELRRSGYGWMEIGHRLGVGAETYYVPLAREPGPPYGKAWGYYRNKPRSEWNEIHLSDRQVVDLVNLRFVSDEWGMDRERIVDARSRGRDYVDISREHWPYDFRPGHRPGDRRHTRDHDWRDHPGRDHDWIDRDTLPTDRRGDAARGDRARRHDRPRADHRGDARGGDRGRHDRKKDDDSPPLV